MTTEPPTMKVHWIDEPLAYDGTQLRAHWILAQFGIAGDALVGFRGPCRVAEAEIADLADLGGPGIAGDDMVHFVWESFASTDLLLAVHRQRLLSAQALEVLRELAPVAVVHRTGDDLWVDARKLSISIATVTPVSAVIHFAVNAVASGTPVPAVGLRDLGVEPPAFGRRLLDVVAAEQSSITEARAKVRAKGEWR